MIVKGRHCRCSVCAKPSPTRTPADANARYKRLRALEQRILVRRARAAGAWLEARMDTMVYRYPPSAWLKIWAQGCSHWHRAYWRLIDPPAGTAEGWRRVLRGVDG